MRVYAIVDEKGKICQSSPQFKGIFGCLIFQTKHDAKLFRDTNNPCAWWKGVYINCKVKRFNIKEK